jgi:hypothetical protein
MNQNFRIGDWVELRAKGMITATSEATVSVRFNDDFFVAKKYAGALDPKLLTNLSDAHEISAEEAK